MCLHSSIHNQSLNPGLVAPKVLQGIQLAENIQRGHTETNDAAVFVPNVQDLQELTYNKPWTY